MTSNDPAIPVGGHQISTDPASLDTARSRRLELGEAAYTTENCLARPASDPMWARRVSEALGGLRAAFSGHVETAERPGGLLSQLLGDVPRLAYGVSRLNAERNEIDLKISEVVDLICVCTPDCDHTVIEDVRVGTVDVLSWISRHRQVGADLVYEAYHVDIGGG